MALTGFHIASVINAVGESTLKQGTSIKGREYNANEYTNLNDKPN